MRYIFLILIFLILSSCIINKKVDDTEHLWKGINNQKFYE